MTDSVSDTHALVWHLTSSPRLGSAAREAFAAADRGELRVYIPTIVAIEIIYLSERRRIPTEVLEQVIARGTVPGGSYALWPLDAATISAVRVVPRASVPELPDRVILATAIALGLPLITDDHSIRSASLNFAAAPFRSPRWNSASPFRNTAAS